MEDVPMRRFLVLTAALGLVLTAAVPVGAAPPHSAYEVTVLVSDTGSGSLNMDGNLVNAWGLTRSGGSPWWVANNGTGTSTLYNGAGDLFPTTGPLVVSVPHGPTGTVADTTPGFNLPNGTLTGARASFLFDTESGQILGWNPTVAPTTAILGLDRSNVGAIYKGLAIALVNGVPTMYAADFHNARVDVVTPDPATLTTWIASNPGFVDPGLPAGYAPFGIQYLNDGAQERIFVTYAKQDADAEDEIAGDGLGYVDAFGLDGSFLGRVASGDSLNAPWGIAMAPANGFGEFSGQLLVGNFGDGRINAFRWGSWEPDGHLKTANHRPLAIDGLWAIAFGAGNTNSGPATSLYYTAGPDDESHGAFGTVTLDLP
jgi:uncharacterized protein (TIGR03118 family)